MLGFNGMLGLEGVLALSGGLWGLPRGCNHALAAGVAVSLRLELYLFGRDL